VQDYAQEATIDRQLHLAVVINKAKLPELISEMEVDTRLIDCRLSGGAHVSARARGLKAFS
jgi:hypothetical protein